MTNAFYELLSGVWDLLLGLLCFILWRRVRHWSLLVLLFGLALMIVLHMGKTVYWFIFDLIVEGSLTAYSLHDLSAWSPILHIIAIIAFVLGVIGGIGALVGLRKIKWSVQGVGESR